VVGRIWWVHLQFTRMNIELTILRKKIEDVREAHPSTGVPCHHEVGKSISGYRRRGRET
jgi:hypothetical protein